MSVIDRFLELQEIDTASDQLRHRIANLPEMTAARQAQTDLLAWERTRAELRDRLDHLDREIQAAEAEAAEIERQRKRLNGQLRTVIAPREAEALLHEIETLTTRLDELDERELAALEEQSEVDDQLVAHAAVESSLRETVDLADAALASRQSDLQAELADLDERRQKLRSELDHELLTRYDRLRAQLGVAVARLVKHRCEGCHMDLSPAEVDIIKAVAGDEIAECPQCSRLLVR